jgi:hypothetical protein
MKFLATTLVFLLLATFLGWGILLTFKGNYWVLSIATLVYTALFIKFGCLPPKKSH